MTKRQVTEQRSFASAATGKPKGKRRTPEVKLEVANAYHAVFVGGSSPQQRDIVMVDLAAFSGFYGVTPAGVDPDTRSFNEGQRAVFGRIVSMLRMPPAERDAFETVVRHESLVNQFEGEL